MKFAAAALAALIVLTGAPAVAQQLNAYAINVVDAEKMRTFYQEAFGLKLAGRMPETGNLYQYLLNWTGVREQRPLIILTKVAGPRKEGQSDAGRLIIGVDDAVAAGRKAVAAGGRARGEIREGAPYTFVFDPEGNLIELFDLTPPARPAAPAAK